MIDLKTYLFNDTRFDPVIVVYKDKVIGVVVPKQGKNVLFVSPAYRKWEIYEGLHPFFGVSLVWSNSNFENVRTK